MIDITGKEYEAIIYAYARLSYIAENDKQPEYIENTQKSDKACVNVLDKMIDRINASIEANEKD